MKNDQQLKSVTEMQQSAACMMWWHHTYTHQSFLTPSYSLNRTGTPTMPHRRCGGSSIQVSVHLQVSVGLLHVDVCTLTVTRSVCVTGPRSRHVTWSRDLVVVSDKPAFPPAHKVLAKYTPRVLAFRQKSFGSLLFEIGMTFFNSVNCIEYTNVGAWSLTY